MAWLAQRVDARTAGMYTLMVLGDKLPLHALSQAFPAASPGNEDSSFLHFWPNYHLRSPQVRTVIYLAPSRTKTCLFMDRQICALFNGPVCFLGFYLPPFGQIGGNRAHKSNNPRQAAEFIESPARTAALKHKSLRWSRGIGSAAKSHPLLAAAATENMTLSENLPTVSLLERFFSCF